MAIGDVALLTGSPPSSWSYSGVSASSVSVDRGRSSITQPVAPGVMEVVFPDPTGALWASPPWAPDDWIRLEGTDELGFQRVLFVGKVESVTDVLEPVGGRYQMVIRATDIMSALGVSVIDPVPDVVGAGDTSTGRITRVLDAHGFTTSSRFLAASTTTLDGVRWDRPALADIRDAATADHGLFFIDRIGVVVYQTKGAPTSSATFGDDGTADVQWRELSRVSGLNDLANFVTAGRSAADTQTAGIDLASVTSYGRIATVNCDVVVDSDSQLTNWATYHAAWRGQMSERFQPMDSRTWRDGWFATVSALDLGDGVTVKATRGGSAVSTLCAVDRMRWRWDPHTKFTCQLSVTPAPVVAGSDWILDNATWSLGAATGLSTVDSELTT